MASLIIYPSGNQVPIPQYSDSSVFADSWDGTSANLWDDVNEGVSSPNDTDYIFIADFPINSSGYSVESSGFVLDYDSSVGLGSLTSGEVRLRARCLYAGGNSYVKLMDEYGLGSAIGSCIVASIGDTLWADFSYPFLVPSGFNLDGPFAKTQISVGSINSFWPSAHPDGPNFQHDCISQTNISEIELEIYGTPLADEEISLYIAGSLSAETGIPLYTCVNIATSGIDLYIAGMESSSSGVDLFIQGNLSASSGIEMSIKLVNVSSGNMPFYLEGKPLLSGDSQISMYACIIGEGYGIQASLGMFISSENFSARMPLYLLGQESDTVNQTMPFYSYGFSKNDNKTIEMSIMNNGVGSSITMYTAGRGTDEFDPLLPGGGLPYASSLPFVLWSPGVSESIPMYVQNQIAESSLTLFVNGANITSGIIDFVMPNVVSDNSSTIKIFTHGF